MGVDVRAGEPVADVLLQVDATPVVVVARKPSLIVKRVQFGGAKAMIALAPFLLLVPTGLRRLITKSFEASASPTVLRFFGFA